MFQDMARTDIHYKKKWLWEDNSVNTQGRIIWFQEFHFNPFCTFHDIAQTGIHYDKYKVKGR